MRFPSLLLCACLLGSAYGQSLNTLTSLQAEMGNNTSVPDHVSGFSNGNLGAGNVSKVPTRKLLYPGATTKIFAHLVPWFGGSDHIQVGYRSDDPNQIRRQVEDMMSRSIDGMIINWYGQNKYNTATLLLMKEIELRNGAFQFSLMPDKAILKSCLNTAGCDVTQKLINELNYAAGTYFPSPAYTRIGGRPLLTFFLTGDVEAAINWTRVRDGVAGDPLFVFQNASGFWHAESDGAFAWVTLNPTNPPDIRLSYLQDWYSVSLQYASSVAIGAAYKGFNDSLASWAPDPPRIMNQYCGQTWITTMAEAWKHYSTQSQLEFMQLVTWNDYEEGTSIEPGIENCVTISGAVSGHILTWSITGAQSTLDHFEIFVSADTTNLRYVASVAPAQRSFDLASLQLPTGNYSVYVKAIGKPSIVNKMTSAIAYSSRSTLNALLSVSPATVSVDAGQSAALQLTIVPTGASLTSPVSFSCAGLPPGATCTFAPANVTPGTTARTISVTLSTAAVRAAAHDSGTTPWFLLATFGTAAIVLAASGRSSRANAGRPAGALILLFALALLPAVGCSGSGMAETKSSPVVAGTPAGTYIVTFTATSGQLQRSVSAVLTVR